MQSNPFAGSWQRRIIVMLAAATMAALLWLFLALYGNGSPAVSLAEALVYTGVLFIAGYFYWYIRTYLVGFPAHGVVALLVQVIALATTWAVTAMIWQIEPVVFAHHIPLLVLFGLSGWTIFSLLNRNTGTEKERPEAVSPEPLSPDREIIDRIPVKESSRIHIIKVEELAYVQAYGDYVMLYTSDGKHIKEQTMKYFEEHLPDHFVRIHRSCIVNTERIARVELFGKENYHIRLQNGTTLKASAGGYKLLKDRLSL